MSSLIFDLKHYTTESIIISLLQLVIIQLLCNVHRSLQPLIADIQTQQSQTFIGENDRWQLLVPVKMLDT